MLQCIRSALLFIIFLFSCCCVVAQDSFFLSKVITGLNTQPVQEKVYLQIMFQRYFAPADAGGQRQGLPCYQRVFRADEFDIQYAA